MAENNQEVSDSDRIADVRANYYALVRSLREAVERASKIKNNQRGVSSPCTTRI